MATALRERLAGAFPYPFGQVDWVEQTGSTNADLLARARARSNGADSAKAGAKPWLLGAHLQQTGRGRAGRAWQNRPGAALMFSCAFDTPLAAASLPVLSPLAGLAACEALRAVAGLGGDGLRVKWPNDVQWGDAKLAGILVETTRNLAARPASHTVVIGMGMNLCDADRLSSELGRDIADWTATRCLAPMSDIVHAVALAWQAALDEVARNGFEAFVERFRRLDALAGRHIRVLDRGAVLHHGIAAGADAHGRLLIRTDAGDIPVSVGEISVRAT
ncbi:biotin--[acetyl-CoA-carboxylase] ligase [Bordetella flabilis]|nr:biotin--[acetyl-CoA-carboxylase] ligase [Bordetella flabilis]